MNDEQLKRELEEALAVEPTPQFLARVRREIETETERPAAHLKWASIAAGVAAAAMVLAIVRLQFEKPKALHPPPSDVVALAPSAAETASTPLPSPKTTPKAESRQTNRRTEQPEVLIDARETAALRSFLQDVQERKIDPARLEDLFESVERARTTTVEPMPIAAIEPIVIMPLSSAAPQSGGDL